jgi:ABC-2 type transport system permease protein
MFIRIWNLIIKEMIQFGRDRLLTVFILLAPALQLLLLAQSIEQGIEGQPAALLDLDQSPESRQLAAAWDNTQELDLQFYPRDMDELRTLLDKGLVRLAIVVPSGFSEDIERANSSQSIKIIGDATNTVAASTIMATAAGVVSRFSRDLAVSRGLTMPQFVDLRTSVRFNPTMDFQDFSIPAQLGFITYQVTLAVAALGLTRERELGTLEQLLVTPLRRFELAVGKGFPAAAIGATNFGIMWFICITVFEVPMRGSPLALSLFSLLFITSVVSWGLVISAISRTQQQAILFVFIQAMVEIALSGFLVSVDSMPAVMQALSTVIPLRHYLAIVRSVMIKGAGLAELWPHVVALAGLSFVMSIIALRTIAKRLE